MAKEEILSIPVRRKSGSGISELARREERLAYFLLVPSFLILLIIAFYPLGSVFYSSLTDQQFGTNTPVHFIGLDNYRRLLSITVRQLPPVIDPATGKPKLDINGHVVYQDSFNVLPRQPTRYHNIAEFNLLGKQFVVGAIDAYFWPSIFDTILFTIFSVVLELILGLGIALVVNMNFKGRGLMRAVMLIPWAIPTAVSSRIWEWMLQPSRVGLFNVISQKLGLTNGQYPFLTTPSFQLADMVAIDVWKTTPFMALLLLAGLQLISLDLYEAADVDGASKFRQFVSITVPLLRPTIAIALVFRTLDALRVFDLFQIVLAQSRYSMASYAYYQLVGNAAMGYSSAASVVIFFLILVFAIIYIRSLGLDTNN
jgi:trehalose/maltose transport system permease protein